MRGVTQYFIALRLNITFLLTRLMRGVTFTQKDYIVRFVISTHTPHARRDAPSSVAGTLRCVFLLTRLMRGVTTLVKNITQQEKISTHTPHARRDGSAARPPPTVCISTHTPHARRDACGGD